MIITREKGMRMWGGGSGSTSASGVNGGGGFSLAVEEGEGTGNAYTGFTYESGTLTLNKATEFVTVDFFNKLFTAYDANGNVIAPNNTTPTLDNIKFKAGAWTEQYLSALGKNSESGGGGTGDVSHIKISSNPDVFLDPVDGIIDMSSYAATWNNKQNTITDLATIRSNASNGNTAYGYFTSGVANNAARLSNTTKIGDTNQPVYFSASGVPVAISYTIGKSVPTNAVFTDTTYKLTLNGTTNGASGGTSLGSFYAPTASGTANQVLISGGSNTAPSWTAQSNLSVGTAAKLGTGTTTYSAWGQTYWSSGVPQSISGNMTSVGSITPSANGNALGTTSARFNIYGTSGNFSGNVSIGGTLGVTGATTLSSTLSVAGGITLTTTKKIYFGDTSHYIELNSTGFHFSHGVYSDSFISALGANSSGGGSGTFDEEAMWTALGTTSTAKVIASSHIPNLSASKITSGTFAAARIPNLSWTKITSDLPTTLSGYGVLDDANDRYYALNGGTDLAPTSTNTINLNDLKSTGSYYVSTNTPSQYVTNKPDDTQDYAFRVWVSAPGGTSGYRRQRFQYLAQMTIYERFYSTDTSSWGSWYLVQDDLTNYALSSSLGGYLPLSGGTLTGGLQVGGNLYTNGFAHMIKFDVDTSRALGYGWWDTNSNTVASIVYHNTAQNIILNPVGSASTYSDAVGKYSLIVGNNKLTYNTYTILHSNNTYVSSGKGYINGTEITTISGNAATASLLSYSHGNEINFKGGMQASCYFNYRNADTGNEDGGTTAINYKFCNYSRSTAYSTVHAGTFVGAFSGNATTATTLQTPRTIWGQSFDGSSDVSGSITGATTITASGRISASAFEGSYVNDGTVFYFGDSQHAIGSGTDAVLWAYGANSLLFYTNNLKRMTINSEGSVGIGTSSPSSKLHVTGNILASGEVTASSDERKKNIISNTKFNVKDIASARSVLYNWNDGRDKDNSKKIHGGSIAQDWIGKADSFLSQDNDGWYSINYGALALCSAITIAREVLKHEDRITLLEKENARLKARVAELEERRVA